MLEYSNLNVSDYLFSPNVRVVPEIAVSLSSGTDEEINAAIGGYLSNDKETGSAIEYWQSVKDNLASRTYVRGRFQKDLMSSIGLAVVNPVENTYTANKKADEIFAEASRGVSFGTVSGLTSIKANAKRIGDNIFHTDDGTELVYGETEAPVAYDAAAITISLDGNQLDGAIFVKAVPNAVGNESAYYSYKAKEGEEGQYEVAYMLAFNDNGEPYVAEATEVEEDGAITVTAGNILLDGTLSDGVYTWTPHSAE